jgi:hypothetical protein
MPFLTLHVCGSSTEQHSKAHLSGDRLPRAGAAAREGRSRGSRAQRAQAGPAPDDVRRLPCAFTSVSRWRRQQRQGRLRGVLRSPVGAQQLADGCELALIGCALLQRLHVRASSTVQPSMHSSPA